MAEVRPSVWRRYAWPLPVALVGGGLVLAVLPHLPSPTSPKPTQSTFVPEPGVRVKGQASLALFRKTMNGSERLDDGDFARARDLIRVGYRAAGKPYGAILSIDGRGAVTLHLPHAGTRAAPLESGGTTLLDQAYELDDAPRWERFYFVTSDERFELAPLIAAARRLAVTGSTGPIDLPASQRQYVVTVKKGSPS